MSDDRIQAFLAEQPYFEAMADFDRNALAASMELRTLPPGTAFIRQGEKADGVFLILSGDVSVTVDRGAGPAEVLLAGPGDFVGLMAMIDGRKRAATCTAQNTVTVAFIGSTVFKVLSHRHARIAYPFQRALGRQVARDFRAASRRLGAALSKVA